MKMHVSGCKVVYIHVIRKILAKLNDVEMFLVWVIVHKQPVARTIKGYTCSVLQINWVCKRLKNYCYMC